MIKSPNEIVLHDEEQPFEEKSQSASLNKSVVQIFYKVSKVITISIYYTTKRCLVQGNTCENWVDEEFKEIKECINTCLKGDNPKLNIDNNIIQMKKINIPIQNVKEDEQQIIPKHVEDSLDESHNINMDDLDEMEINNNKICQSTENQQKGNDKHTKQDDNSSNIPGHDKTGSEPQNI